jgi:CRAL/TRIO domain
MPMRHKEIHGLKVHTSIKFAVDFALSQMSEKMRKRVSLHKSVEDVKNIVDRELLPAEYGGKIPMRQMIDAFKQELEAKRDLLFKHDEMSVKLDLYPEAVRLGSVRSLKKTIDSFDEPIEARKEPFGLQGSFRKLEID